MENAKHHIIAAIVGLLVIVLVFVIVKFILSILGANVDTNNFIFPSIEE